MAKETSTTEPGTAVEPESRDDASVARLTFNDLKEMLTAARDEATLDPEAVEKRIFEQMLNARSVEELLVPQQVESWSKMLDTPVLVREVSFMQSDFGDGDQLYAIIQGSVAGKPTTLSCGARTPMVQLLIMRSQGWFPALLQLCKSPRPTEAGFYPLNLLPATVEEPF